jgi:hypothetical protein
MWGLFLTATLDRKNLVPQRDRAGQLEIGSVQNRIDRPGPVPGFSCLFEWLLLADCDVLHHYISEYLNDRFRLLK